MGRLSGADMGTLWLAVLAILILITGSAKYSLVLSVFVVVNVLVLIYWFALSAPNPDQVSKFLEGCHVGAHRGLADDAPENTLGAFKLAQSMGADTVELDLEFTSDGVAVILHDDTLERTTDGKGRIADTSFEQLRTLNAAAKFPNRERFPFEKVPTLEEALSMLILMNVRIIIDVKNPHPLVTPTLVAMFRSKRELYERAAVCSFFPAVAFDVKRADPRILTGHTWRPGFFAFKDIANTEPRYPDSALWQTAAQALDALNVWFLHSWMWKLSGASLVLTQQRQISANYVSEWRRKGLTVMAWTSNSSPERLFFLHDLAIPILTDRLSDFQNELSALRRSDATEKT